MIISTKVLEERRMENIEKDQEMPVKKEYSPFWTDEEVRFFNDLARIEKSKMLWPEKKFYSTMAELLYSHTNYYGVATTIGEILGWTEKSPETSRELSRRKNNAANIE